jgi:hypothetical protein
MNIPEVIELLLDRMNTRNQFVGGTFAAFGGSAGNMQMLQKDANAAITLWREKHDVAGIRQLASTLHAYSSLNDADYEQIMETLDGEDSKWH